MLSKRLIAATLLALLLLMTCAGDGWPPYPSSVLPPDSEPAVELIASGEVPERDPDDGQGLPDSQQEKGVNETGPSADRPEQRADGSEPHPGRMTGDGETAVGPTPTGSGTRQGTNSIGMGPGGLLTLSLLALEPNGASLILNEVDAWLASWTPPAALLEQPSLSDGPVTGPASSPDQQLPAAHPPRGGGSGPPLQLPAEDGQPGADPNWPSEREATAIPEPSLPMLLLIGLIGLVWARWRCVSAPRP